MTIKKPVTLQVNNSGAWKNVLRFDAANGYDSADVMHCAARLGALGGVTFRIVVADDGRSPTVLTTWSPEDGWKDIK